MIGTAIQCVGNVMHLKEIDAGWSRDFSLLTKSYIKPNYTKLDEYPIKAIEMSTLYLDTNLKIILIHNTYDTI